MRIISDVYKKNIELLSKMGIHSAAELHDELGDRYNTKKRYELYDVLPHNDALKLREGYLKECNPGIDRAKACLKIKIHFLRNSVWQRQEDHVITELSASYDRIKTKLSLNIKTNSGDESRITFFYDLYPLSERSNGKYYDEIFQIAETSFWDEDEDQVSYTMDAPTFEIDLFFSNGKHHHYRGTGDGMPIVKELSDHLAQFCPHFAF